MSTASVSPGSGSKRRRTTNAREGILDAAQRVALRDGSAHLTIDSVARESGLSKGGVLYHFPSKEALLEAMVERLAAVLRQIVEERRPAHAEKRCPTLHALLDASASLDWLHSQAPSALLAAAAERPQLLAPIRAELMQYRVCMEQETGDPDLAMLLWAAADGLMLQLLLGVAPFAAERQQELIARLHDLADQVVP